MRKYARPLRVLAVMTAVSVLSVVSFFYYIGYFTGNIRAVVPGRVYRSAQLSPGRLGRLIREHGIRTVVCLRGGDEEDEWYRQEQEACRREGARLVSVSLRATALPPPRQINRLIHLLDRSQYPILMHCQGGADRSGLAATLYLHMYRGLSLDEAQRRGLTWRYGHFRVRAAPMDEFLDLYRSDGRGRSLRLWIRDRYPVVYERLRRQREEKNAQLRTSEG